jgi:hypothetical protein
MPEQTVGDVIGVPESWPNYSNPGLRSCGDMRGAQISEVRTSPDGLAVATRGSACGETYTVFAIEDAELIRRVAAVLEIGQDVQVAVTRPIGAAKPQVTQELWAVCRPNNEI